MQAQRQLGAAGPTVSAVGLGCMGMSGTYGKADREESIATIHAALDAGMTLLDTGDFYGMGHNEMLLCEALAGRELARLRRQTSSGQDRSRLFAAATRSCPPAASSRSGSPPTACSPAG